MQDEQEDQNPHQQLFQLMKIKHANSQIEKLGN